MNTRCTMYLLEIALITAVLIQPLSAVTTTRSPDSGNVSEETITNSVTGPLSITTTTPLNNATSFPDASTESGLKSIAEEIIETCKPKTKRILLNLTLEDCHIEEILSPTLKKRRRKIKVGPKTRRALTNTFGGILLTGEQIDNQTRARRLARRKRRQERSTGVYNDGDMCCPTETIPEKLATNMTNLYGELRYIVHFPDDGVFQYAITARCGAPESCSGQCITEMGTVYLLVWKEVIEEDDTMPVTFEPFELSSYCSCKNISP